MKIKPLHDHVLVKRSEADDISKGGIYIPENAKERPMRGEVLAVGAGRVLDTGVRVPVAVEPGNIVLFSRYAGSSVEPRDDTTILVREADILAVLEDA